MLSKVIFTSLLSVAVAQTTVTVDLLGMDEGSSYPVSVIAVASDATTYMLGCPTATACDDFPDATLVLGPSTYSIAASKSGYDITATQKCNVVSSTATCVESLGGSDAGSLMAITTSTYLPTDFSQATFTLTGGADKISASGQSSGQPTAQSTSASDARSTNKTASLGSTMTSMATTKPASTGSNTSGAPSKTSSGAPANTSNAAPANLAMVGGSLMGVAAGVIGGLVL